LAEQLLQRYEFEGHDDILIGPEYRAAAEGLTENGRRPIGRYGRSSRRTNGYADKRERAHSRLEEPTRQSIDDALRLIDELDEDERLLRGRVRVLEQRLRKREIVVTHDKRVPRRPRPTLGLVPADTRFRARVCFLSRAEPHLNKCDQR
jgi:hypothetical protein